MSESTVDRLLSSFKPEDRKQLQEMLQNGAIAHTEVADVLGVGEASIRRWRKANGTQRTLPKILIWDIESSPVLGYTWGLWEQNVLSVVQDWKLLTVSWSWYGSGEYHAKQLSDFKGYKKGDLDDYALTEFVRDLLDEADYSVAHNGNAFDVKKVNAKIAEHRLAPPAPHTQIDTLTVARRNMKMSSNKLDSLGVTLGVGRKVKHSGFDLWLRCMAGEKAAWEEMREYAIQDVRLLEAVFERLLPWIKGLNYGQFSGEFVCTNCGSAHIEQGGQYRTAARVTPAWQCSDCGSWTKETKRPA